MEVWRDGWLVFRTPWKSKKTLVWVSCAVVEHSGKGETFGADMGIRFFVSHNFSTGVVGIVVGS